MIVFGNGVVATWTHVKLYGYYSQRAYWTVENTSSSPQKAGCAGYQNYGLKGYKVQIFYHTTFNYEWEAIDAKCVDLGGDYRETLEPGQTITSWADFEYSGKKGTCTALTLPTGPNVPEHVGYTKCVNPYARYLGSPELGTPEFKFPWDEFESDGTTPRTLAYTGGPHVWEAPNWSGLDFASGSDSTHILAMADGEVTFVGWEDCIDGPKTCQVVKVSHDNGWDVWYVHLSSFATDIWTQCNRKTSANCSTPVPVEQGRYLGNEGGTGARGVIHIHIELRKGATPHEWSEVPWGIQGWEFHRDCDGYDKSKATYDEKLKKYQNQECTAYKTNGVVDGYNYDGYMSKGNTHAIPWVDAADPRYYVHSTNHEL